MLSVWCKLWESHSANIFQILHNILLFSSSQHEMDPHPAVHPLAATLNARSELGCHLPNPKWCHKILRLPLPAPAPPPPRPSRLSARGSACPSRSRGPRHGRRRPYLALAQPASSTARPAPRVRNLRRAIEFAGAQTPNPNLAGDLTGGGSGEKKRVRERMEIPGMI